MPAKVFAFPGRYVQGNGVIKQLVNRLSPGQPGYGHLW